MLWQIAEATGWSIHYILWEVPYPILQLMLSDAPRYIKVRDEQPQAQGKGKTSGQILNFFQTRLK